MVANNLVKLLCIILTFVPAIATTTNVHLSEISKSKNNHSSILAHMNDIMELAVVKSFTTDAPVRNLISKRKLQLACTNTEGKQINLFTEMQQNSCKCGNTDCACVDGTSQTITSGPVTDTRSTSDWRKLTEATLASDIAFFDATVRWKDQGWGGSKGYIRAVLKRDGIPIKYIYPRFGTAPKDWATKSVVIEESNSNELEAKSGDVLTFEYHVGGGGGHVLYIETFEANLGRADCSSLSGMYCISSSHTCTARPPTTCLETTGLIPNTIDCRCGTAECNPTTGSYCVAEQNTCYAQKIPGKPTSVAVRIGDPPLTDEFFSTLTRIVYQNDDGANAATDTWLSTINVQPNTKYSIAWQVLRSDLASSSENVVDVQLDSLSVGGCNPPGEDYACDFYDCTGSSTQYITSATGVINVAATFTGHSKDCDCDRSDLDGKCAREDTVNSYTPTKAALKFILTAMPTTLEVKIVPPPDSSTTITHYNVMEYIPLDTKRTWQASEDECAKLGNMCHMASVHSTEENQIIMNLVVGYSWFGLNDRQNRGSWKYTDEST